METHNHGECDIHMFFSNALRICIPISLAIVSLRNALQVAQNSKHES